METIGLRELRQNASKYVHRAAAGESITITEHGRAVAELRPLQAHQTLYDRMVASGEIIPAEQPTGVLFDKPLEPLDLGFSASAELERQREDRL